MMIRWHLRGVRRLEDLALPQNIRGISQGDLESDSGDLRKNLVLVDVSELVAVIGPITLTRRRFSGVKPEELYSRIHTELCLTQPGRRGCVLQ